ncbi:MAG: hypothetical protein H7287_12215, partial [Thermoleophilia bacterium]|nr:hypothetical protein [Thermoleophilia bacterium]
MPSTAFVPRPRRLVVASLIALAASITVPAISHAALILNAGYTSTAGQGGNSMGQSDDNGVLYTAYGTTIKRYDPAGARLPDINLAGLIGSTNDVAPSPDGKSLYVPQGTNPVVRVTLNAAGAWVKDAAWKLQNIPAGGTTWAPVGSDLYVDGRGDIYFSTGSNWVSNTVRTIEVIAKFKPDGTYITAFGAHGVDPGQWNANQDVVVSRDGTRVYVGENCGVQCIDSQAGYQPSRVARWDYVVGTGQYRYTKLLSAQGATNGHPYPYCEDAGAVHSAYSLAIDNASNVYATSTTCGRIQQFSTNADPAMDRFVKSIATNTDAVGSGVRNHYLNSDLAGRLFANEWGLRITPNVVPVITLPLRTPAALPLPDVTAPKLTTVTMPTSTTTRAVAVTIAATDDTAVTELRLANEDGSWGP